MSNSAPPAPRRPQRRHPAPVLRVTFYDRVSSFLMSAVSGLLIAVLAIIALVPAESQQTPPRHTMLGYVPGGLEQGAPDETLHIDSPDAPIPNASAMNEDVRREQVEATLATVMELAETATQRIQQPPAPWMIAGGVPGGADGTGRRRLGDLTAAGARPEQRWYVQFDETVSVDEYARQLEFFGIELGALYPDRGELIYLSNPTGDSPTTRVVTTGDDQRLYMYWRGGRRRAADVALYERAGVDVTGAVLMHFYPRQTEELLARLEYSFAHRPPDQIRRTYFVVVEQENSYSFTVTRQHYNR